MNFKNHKVILAKNGKEGLELAKYLSGYHNLPMLLCPKWMVFEFCKKIKGDMQDPVIYVIDAYGKSKDR